MRALMLLALFPFSLAGFAADPGLQAVFERMDKASAAFKGFTADLEKIDYYQIVETTDKSVGTMAVRKSGPHSIQVLEKIETQNGNPDGEQMELSATRFRIYHAKANTVSEYDLGKKYRGAEEAALAVLGGSSKDLQQDYKVTYGGPDTVNGQACVRLVLNPNDPQFAQTFPKLEVWISDQTGIAIQQKLYQKGEKDYQIQTYKNMKFGTISEDQVKMKLPKNVKVERAK